MSITGRLNVITNPAPFFLPLANGGSLPGISGNSAPLVGVPYEIILLGTSRQIPLLQFPIPGSYDPKTGHFTIPPFPAGLPVDHVSLHVSLYHRPFYRSESFPYSTALEKPLNIYLTQQKLPASDGITAGFVSDALNSVNAGLPSDTVLLSNSGGITIVGDQSGANIEFTVGVVPDTSTNLSAFVDLELVQWDITVGFPADWCTNAGDILKKIRSALGNASGVNTRIEGLIASIFRTSFLLNANQAASLLAHLSITFSSISFPSFHAWALSNDRDKTPVITVLPTIGWPRRW